MKFLDAILGVSDGSAGERLRRMLLGVAVPLIPILYGIWCMISRDATIVGRRGFVSVSGLPALLVGLGYTAAGICLYVHYCWDDHPQLGGMRDAARVGLLVIVAGSLLWTVAAALL